MRFLYYTFLAVLSLGFLGLIGAVGGAAYIVHHYSQDLPDYAQLKDYSPRVVTRLYAGDGSLMEEYADENRVFVPVEAVPDLVKNAFIAAEDQNFRKHHGVDYTAIARAMVSNLRNMGKGRRPEGASTITQQVAKNFLLTNEVSIKRKIREAILAWRIEQVLTKNQILELYLNQIYLGGGSYGVAAAALNYFGKSLEELDIEEAAYLAALPKAPNNYHPLRHQDAAIARRNWVIERMAKDGYIAKEQASLAAAKPLTTVLQNQEDLAQAAYFAEEVRRELKEKFGGEMLYGGGMAVRTTLDPRLQKIAVEALRKGLMDYDRRHGWRGPLAKITNTVDWPAELAAVKAPEEKLSSWHMAAVLEVSSEKAEIGVKGRGTGVIPLEHLKWARECLKECYSQGPEITSAEQVLKKGDVVLVASVEAAPADDDKAEKKKAGDENNVYELMQIPKIQGALIAMDPHTGRVLAMQGGWTYDTSEFNRATQAWRQPGSAFKPFVYLAALDKGFTPATLVLDAPFVFDQGPGMPKWRPTNYKDEFYGPTPIRVGVEKSRNLMTVRLADYVGMDTVIQYSERFGVMEKMQPYLSYALGSGETTLLKLTTGYAQLVNGGKRIAPTFIDRIQDRRGKTEFAHDARPCEGCGPLIEWDGQPVPDVPDTREQIGDPRTVYQIVSILEGVVLRGTAARIASLGRPLAGKTGTTNESKDTWFIGFSPDLAVGVFAGFDDPRSLGKRETGASIAVPVFKDFMEQALKDTPPMPFRIPPGIRQVQINAHTGTRARPGDKDVIWEAFIAGTEPTDEMFILDGKGLSTIQTSADAATEGGPRIVNPVESATTGTGGLY